MNAIGQPISRTDGRLKVTGGARYTADIPVADAAHGAIVHSTIARGRTVSIDTTAAENASGVLAVFTHRTMPRLNPTPKPWSHLHPHGQSYLPLQDEQIHYAGQPVALVVAGTLDEAMHAGALIRGGVRSRAAGRVRPADCEGCRRSAAVPVAGRLVGRRCRRGNRGRGGQDRAELHDVRSPPQPDGAARDDRGLGRRRHADPLRDDAAHLRHQGPGRYGAGRPAGEDQRRVAVPGGRLRRQGLCVASHPDGRGGREGR